jgi:ribosomal protein L11 methyltransferase
MIRLAVRVRRERAEIVLAELLELAPAGVEEVDRGDGTVEYAVYGAAGEIPELPALCAVAGGELVDVTSSELEDDWAERWKSFHRPVVVTPSRDLFSGGRDGRSEFCALRIRPPWSDPIAGPGDGALQELVIDPGQAFGTGAHPTTRLCLELLLAVAAESLERGAVTDVGAGTGVLAIAAARLGFAPVLAIDNELESVRAVEENAAVNGVEVTAVRADLRSDTLASPPPTLVTANLLRPLLLVLAQTLPWTPQALIAGGLLLGEADEIAGSFAERHGMRERARLEEGGWAALLLAAT